MANSYAHLSFGERAVIPTKIGVGWSIRAKAGYLAASRVVRIASVLKNVDPSESRQGK